MPLEAQSFHFQHDEQVVVLNVDHILKLDNGDIIDEIHLVVS